MSDSVLRRFGATLLFSAVGAGVSFLATLVVIRTIGARAFGDYSFLLASWAALNGWLDLGTSTAFYTFVSKGEFARAHARLYAAWLSARLIFVAAIVALMPSAWLARIWVGQPRFLVFVAWVAFFASVVLRGYLVTLAESVRRTVFVQTSLVVLSVLDLVLVCSLRFWERMSLPALFGVLLFEYIALSAWFIRRYDPAWLGPASPHVDALSIARRYAIYCAPLTGYAALGSLADYADRWLLQLFGGSAQQGYFALSFQFSAIALMATGSLLNIFWKEIAAAAAAGDRIRLRDVYARASSGLFFVAAAAGAFAAFHARTIVAIAAGLKFTNAWAPLALMFTYPAFQSLGQINGAFFYATEATHTQVAITSVGLVFGLPLTYLALAPHDAPVPGLGLGALGLAARLWLVQAAVVTMQCVVVSRRLGGGGNPVRYWTTLGTLLTLSMICAAFGTWSAGLISLPRPDIVALILSAVPYGLVLAGVLWLRPSLAGVDQGHIDRILNWQWS